MCPNCMHTSWTIHLLKGYRQTREQFSRIVQITFEGVSKLRAEELCKLYLKGFQRFQLSSEILPRRIEDTERPSEQRNKRFADKLLLSLPPIQFHPEKFRTKYRNTEENCMPEKYRTKYRNT